MITCDLYHFISQSMQHIRKKYFHILRKLKLIKSSISINNN